MCVHSAMSVINYDGVNLNAGVECLVVLVLKGRLDLHQVLL